MNPTTLRLDPSLRFTLAPLASALMAALPLLAQAQARAPVAATQLPVPASAGWRVNGSGGAWAPNGANAVVDQQSQRAIYQWQSFNIGSGASVTYQFKQADGSALNRVVGGDPSQIFGRLASTVPGADGKPVTGGTVLLINPNGILFGKGSRVDTGALIASTLNVSDTDYLSGFNDSINAQASTFRHEGGAELFTDERSFVLVESGAQIATPNGGRIFLFAKNVRNEGSLSTPGGQTVLAGGDEVFLNDPGSEKLYASEANPAVPALRGLLVEVGRLPGSATNAGSIDVPRGNATLVGLAVNQLGRISATTSVSENGSVFLLARGNAVAAAEGNAQTKRAQTGGTLTLGAGSRIDIAPDGDAGADGKPATIDGNASFTASRVELAGATILLDRGAAIRAPGAVVNLRAEATPSYAVNPATIASSDTARIVLAEDALIDVSGTTGASASVGRNFVTTELLGGSDLADSPLQRNGPLYRSRVTLDLRKDAPILSDASIAAYRNAIRKTVEERMSAGGSVTLASQGAVVTHERSSIDVSGGKVSFTDAEVKPSLLIASDGTRYSVNDAPKDLVYAGIEGAPSGAQDRWGVVPQWLPQRQHVEAGYVQGQAAGSVNVLARNVVLDGRLRAATVAGDRQQSGADPFAAAGTLEIGRRSAGNTAFGSSAFGNSAMVADFRLGATRESMGSDFWTDPLTAAMATSGRIATRTLNDAGFGQVFITTAGSLRQESGADIALPTKGSLQLRASGEEGVVLDASIRGTGASVLVQTADLAPGQRRGDITLSSASVIDTSGNWVNRSIDILPPAVAGGSVQLLAGHSLDLKQGSAVDVSGGVTVSPGGAASGTAAGRIALESSRAVSASGDAIGDIGLGAQLSGYGMSQGATLRVRAAEVDLVAADAGAAVRNGATPSSLTLTDEFFTQGGFASYDVEGAQRLQVHGGAVVAPRTDNWVAPANARNVASGAKPSSVMLAERLPDAQRRAANLTLSSGGLVLDGSDPSGQLSLDAGARISADALAKVKLSANARLVVDGRIDAAGGQVALSLEGKGSQASPYNLTGFEGLFDVGPAARIDVSGTTLLTPVTDGTRQGRVLDGGSISLSVTDALTGARRTPVNVSQGALLRADGARDQLQMSVQGASGVSNRLENVVGAAGSISITAQEGGAALRGNLQARSADASDTGGRLGIAQGTSPHDATQGGIDEYRIDVSAGPISPAWPGPGAVHISASSINAGGFGELSLVTPQRVNFDGKVSLNASRSLAIDAAVVSATSGSDVLLAAPSLRLSAPSTAPALNLDATGGNARLVLAGGYVALAGTETLQGIGQFTAAARSRVELQGVLAGTTLQGGALRTQGNVTLSAPQTTLATATSYTIDAPGHTVSFTEGRASDAPILSAGATLRVNAKDILQDGVLRAPLGSIELDASDRLTLAPRSVTSVSGQGLVVPMGTTSGGADWHYLDAAMSALPEKSVRLIAPDGKVTVAQGATVDLSGDGKALAVEFVPGPGGSKDALAGAAQGAFAVMKTAGDYAPYDAQFASLVDSTGAASRIPVGRTITFGANAPLPAGTYAVLPARYALLPGAYLVTPADGAGRVDAGVAQPRPDGSVLVGATLGVAGTGASTSATGYIVRSASQAASLSEIRSTDVDALVAANALRAGKDVPRLAQDAGSLDVAARQLDVAGSFRFDKAGEPLKDQAARGGAVAITAGKIEVVDTAVPTADSLQLSVSQLNALGADTLTLGAVRRASPDGTRLDVGASDVRVSSTTQVLTAQDIVLVATGRVSVADGAKLAAQGSGAAQALTVDGDGALVRVSSDPTAATVRQNALRIGGEVDVGAGADLRGASLTVESTAGTRISDRASLEARVFTIGAPRIAVVGTGDATPPPADALVLSNRLTTQLSHADGATLRSFSGIDFIGDAQLGGADLQALTLDAGSLRVASLGARVDVSAGDVRLVNSSGAAAPSEAGQGTLDVRALGGAKASGDLRVGPGNIAVAGAASTTLSALRSVVFEGQSTLDAGGNLGLRGNTITASQGANAVVNAGGQLVVDRPTGTDDSGHRADAGAGASLALNADRVTQNGSIELPSGVLDIHAAGTSGGPAVIFDDGSVTRLNGRSANFDGKAVASAGGTLNIVAAQGDIRLVDPSVVDVSAGGPLAQAGQVSLSAVNGRLTVDGTLLATSAAGAGRGGVLRLDSAQAFSLDQLSGQIDAGRGAGLENFGRRIEVRNRDGNQVLEARTTLAAENLALSSDNGRLDIEGTLDASGAHGGNIRLAASGDVTLSGRLLARGATSDAPGGDVQLMSSAGRLHLDPAAVADTGGNGRLLLRASREGLTTATSPGTDVAIDALAGDLGRAGRIEVEAVKTYSSSTVNAALVTRIANENLAFAGSDGAKAGAMRDRLAGGDAVLASQVGLRAGVDVRASGNITVTGDPAVQGWNLTSFDAGGSVVRPGGEPMNLTLRAAGNLVVSSSISDGFRAGGSSPTNAAAITPQATVTGTGSSLRLVGGADLGAANPLDTLADGGDVLIGKPRTDVLVRSSTGSIDIAAGRDVKLLNAQAVAYTTGKPMDAASLPGYIGPAALAGYIISGAQKQSPMTAGGGSIAVDARRDVVGAADATQYGTDWWWRNSSGDSASWWSRYDKFKQGFGALGGGDVQVSAGRDAVQVQLAAPSVGYLSGASGARKLAGGSARLEAGRDVLGGWVFAGGDHAGVRAGGTVAASADGAELQVLYANTDVAVTARGDVDVGRVSQAGLLDTVTQWAGVQQPFSWRLAGSAADASLVVVSDAGNTVHSGVRPSWVTPAISSDDAAYVIPSRAVFAAPEGSVTVAQANGLTQAPAQRSELTIAARDDVHIGDGDIRVEGARAEHGVPQALSFTQVSKLVQDPFTIGSAPLQDRPDAVRIVARDGSIDFKQSLSIAAPLRMSAGQDIRQGEGAGRVTFQHTDDKDLSLISAGSDIRLTPSTVASSATVTAHGPGDVVVVAGRDIDLGQSGGIASAGNRENGALPAASARLTVLAGIAFDRGDYVQASQRYVQLLGGNGVVGHAGELAAQLDAIHKNAAPGPVTAGSADAWNLLSAAEKLQRSRELAGDAAFDATVLRFFRERSGDPALSLAAARDKLAALDDTGRSALAAHVVADDWLARTTESQQIATVTALAAGGARAQELRRFVDAQTGTASTDLADALQRFASLPIERQLLQLNAVLASDLRSAGREASALSGAARDAAYEQGYAALAAMFPSAGDAANLEMGASQLKTLQGSGITALAPRGGINVGALTASSSTKSSSELGIVTTAGGPVTLAVKDTVAVNRSRVFTVGKGDLLIWASEGNIDAGRGAKTVTGAPPPVYRVVDGRVVVDTSASYAGSGIAVLDADSTLDLYAPRGEINSGDAGIKSAGNAFLGAARFVGADNLQVGGVVVGAPPAPPAAGGTASLAAAGQSATGAVGKNNADDEEEERRRKRRARRDLMLDFLGFGEKS